MAERVLTMPRPASVVGEGHMQRQEEEEESLQGKPILLLPLSGGGFDVKTTDINRLLEVYGIQKLTKPAERPETPADKKAETPADKKEEKATP